jgi:predicted ATP-dependent endonuclease of OLD family
MKLLDITIKNFRSINGEKTKLTFENSDIIFVLGQNNAGKSSLLSAYEYLITPKQKTLISDFFGFDESNTVEILATFLKDEGDDEIFEKKGFNKWVDSNNQIKFRKTWLKANEEGQKETFDPEINDYVLNGFGGLEQHFTKEAPTPVRIPAILTPSELTKFIKETVQKSVLRTLKEDEAEAYQRVINEIENLHDRILSKDSLSQKTIQANNNFQKIFPELTLEISQIEGNQFDITSSLEKEFSVVVKDSKFPDTRQDFSHHGHGVIRQTIFNFLGVVKNELPVDNDNKSNRKDFLILFEEPEIYLHPKAVKALRKVLYELCSNSCFQILCASHSPSLIDISKPQTSIVRMVKDQNRVTSLYQVGHDIFSSSDEQKNMVQMINKFDPNICESFFADEVILVEGDTEKIVVREILEKKYPNRDIFVTNTGSKNNIPFFQKIFSHFNIKQHIIHDSDTRYIYNIINNEDESKSYKVKINKDEQPKKNPSWKLNEEIWAEIIKTNELHPNLAQRFVSIYNFESSNNYTPDLEKGKPLSAYNYVKVESNFENSRIYEIIKMIMGDLEPDSNYSNEELERIVKEPV